MLEGYLFIANNARFDYGFLKNEFKRKRVAPPSENIPYALVSFIFLRRYRMALHEQQLKHIKTWQPSGASKTVYCQNNGVNIKTFSR